ncbi:hypothetical protein [Nostoc sp. CALU 1950]
MMPEMDGYEMLRQIPELQNIPAKRSLLHSILKHCLKTSDIWEY